MSEATTEASRRVAERRRGHGPLARTLALAVACGLLLACGAGPDSGPHRGQGVVREVKSEARQIVIDHEEIPGLMMAMTMGFDVEDPELLEGISPGQAIGFDVVYSEGRYRITAITPRE